MWPAQDEPVLLRVSSPAGMRFHKLIEAGESPVVSPEELSDAGHFEDGTYTWSLVFLATAERDRGGTAERGKGEWFHAAMRSGAVRIRHGSVKPWAPGEGKDPGAREIVCVANPLLLDRDGVPLRGQEDATPQDGDARAHPRSEDGGEEPRP